MTIQRYNLRNNSDINQTSKQAFNCENKLRGLTLELSTKKYDS